MTEVFFYKGKALFAEDVARILLEMGYTREILTDRGKFRTACRVAGILRFRVGR